MPYGTMHDTTRSYLTELAVDANIFGAVMHYLAEDLEFNQYSGLTDDGRQVYQVSIVFGGALDEEFYITGPYEVNIADWLAEQCKTEAQVSGGEEWVIEVTDYRFEEAGDLRYRVTSREGE